MGQGKRSRLTYERMAALVSAAPASNANVDSLSPLKRIQSINYSFDVNKKTIKQLDSFEFIKAAPVNGVQRLPSVTQPTVNVDIEYLFSSGENEEAIGFSPVGQILQSNYLSKKTPGHKDDVNLIILGSSSTYRDDIVGSGVNLSGFDVIGFGNSYLQKYSYSAAVGQFPKCSVSYLCSNATFDVYDPTNNPDIKFPSVNPHSSSEMTADFFDPNPVSGIKFKDSAFKELGEVSVIKPGEIKIDITKNDPHGFSTLVLNDDSVAIQSASITLNFDRSDIQGLGSSYVDDRKIKYPVVGDLSLDFILREFNTGTKLENIFSHDSDYTIKLNHTARDPSTETANWESFDVASMQIDHAKLKSENFSSSIGANASVSTNFIFEVTPVTGMSLVYRNKTPPPIVYNEIVLSKTTNSSWAFDPHGWYLDDSLLGVYKLVDDSYYELKSPPPHLTPSAPPPESNGPSNNDFWEVQSVDSVNYDSWVAYQPYLENDVVAYQGRAMRAKRNQSQEWHNTPCPTSHKVMGRIYYRGEEVGWQFEGQPTSVSNLNYDFFSDPTSPTPDAPRLLTTPQAAPYFTNNFLQIARNNHFDISSGTWIAPWNGAEVALSVLPHSS